jgi:maleylpyruvate isomerase
MRVREVWLHAIDLDNGVSVDDLPSGVVDALLDDVTAALARKDTCPALVLSPTDRRGTWRIGAAQADGSGSTAELRATAADTMGWLTGRIPSSALRQDLPVLPSWL